MACDYIVVLLGLLLVVVGTLPPVAVGSPPKSSNSNSNTRAILPASVRGASTARPNGMEPLCSSIGATYVTWPASPQPTCRLYVQHQGTERFADVYFPAGYSASSNAPLWLILHGLYSVQPAAGGSPPSTGGLNHIKRAAEHVAGSMGLNTAWMAKEAVLVYPDSTGKLPGFQMWNSGFWQCPYKSYPSHCTDSATDDVGFLETLTKALGERLPSKPADVYALGFSNGGMILQRMLCKSAYMRSTLTAVALVNTVLRKAYLEEDCVDVPAAAANSRSSSQQQPQQQVKVPTVFIHGLQDSLFPFYEGSSSATGDVLLSTLEMADDWAAKYSCSGSKGKTPLVLLAGEGVACRDLCTAAAGGSIGDTAAAGQRPAALWLCGVQRVGHEWTPVKADVAWTFFTRRELQPAALPEPGFPTWQVPGASAQPSPAADAEAPLSPAPPPQQQPPQSPTQEPPASTAPAVQQPATGPPTTAAAASAASAASAPAAAQASGKGPKGRQQAPAAAQQLSRAAADQATAAAAKKAAAAAPAAAHSSKGSAVSQSAQAKAASTGHAAPAGKPAAPAAAAAAAAPAAAAAGWSAPAASSKAAAVKKPAPGQV